MSRWKGNLSILKWKLLTAVSVKRVIKYLTLNAFMVYCHYTNKGEVENVKRYRFSDVW